MPTFVTKLIHDTSPDFGDNPQTITESGKPESIEMQNLIPNTYHFVKGEIYQDGVLNDTTSVETFSTLPAGSLSLTYYSTTRSGYLYDYTWNYTSTYAPSSVICTVNNSTFNGYFDYNQHTLNFNITGLSPSTTYPTVVTLTDIYGETVTVNGSITTTYVNNIYIMDTDADENFVDVGLSYVVDGGFFSGWVDVWYDYQDPSTDLSLQHYSFSEGDTVIHCDGLADNTGYLFRASITLDDRTTVINSNVVDVDTLEATYLSITDISGVVNTLKLTKTNADGNAPTVALEYSTDKLTWTTWEENNNERSLAIPANGTVYFRGNNPNGFAVTANNNNRHTFTSTGNVEANGDVMRIINKDRDGATTVPAAGFRSLFYGMTTLKKAPAISATTFGSHACCSMFQGCTGLTDVTNIKITNNPTFTSGGIRQFFAMFYSCRALTRADVFNGGAIVGGQEATYREMFGYCQGMTTAPAFIINNATYQMCMGMFYSCTALTDASNIQINDVSAMSTCYQMFYNCTSLTILPIFNKNITTVGRLAFGLMFKGCTSLTEGLDIRNITSPLNDSIDEMYNGCTSLSIAYAPTVTWNTGNSTDWLNNVAATGTLYADKSIINSIPTSNASGCPTGWNMYENEYIDKYFTITNEYDGNNTISIKASQTPSSAVIYSVSTNNGNTWTDKTINSTTAVTLGTLYKNGSMLIKSTFSIDVNITATQNFSVSGNIRSLHFGDNFLSNGNPGRFVELFKNNTKLISAENLVLYTNLSYNYTGYGDLFVSGKYTSMFQGCTNLIKSPRSLPAQYIVYNAYQDMFARCTHLTTVPKMEAVYVEENACEEMFYLCESITYTPEIKITTLDEYACHAMFSGCGSLTTASDLPATYIPKHAYDSMFSSCRNLTKAPSTIGGSRIENWGCSAMFMLCSRLETAPYIPTSAGEGGFAQMFAYCGNLKQITVGALSWGGYASANEWVKDVSPTGTFTKPSATSIETGVNGIPEGWTVVNV